MELTEAKKIYQQALDVLHTSDAGNPEYQRLLVQAALSGECPEAKQDLLRENWADEDFNLTEELFDYVYKNEVYKLDGCSWPDHFSEIVLHYADKKRDITLLSDLIYRSGYISESWSQLDHRLSVFKAILWGCDKNDFLYGHFVDAAHLKASDTQVVELVHQEFIHGNMIAAAIVDGWSETALLEQWTEERKALGFEPEPQDVPPAEDTPNVNKQEQETVEPKQTASQKEEPKRKSITKAILDEDTNVVRAVLDSDRVRNYKPNQKPNFTAWLVGAALAIIALACLAIFIH